MSITTHQVILNEPQLTALRSPVLGNHGILSHENSNDSDDETIVAAGGGSEVGESVVSFGGSLRGTPKSIKKGGKLTYPLLVNWFYHCKWFITVAILAFTSLRGNYLVLNLELFCRLP